MIIAINATNDARPLGQRIPGNDDPARFQKTLKLDYSLFKKATMQGCMGDQGLREIEIV